LRLHVYVFRKVVAEDLRIVVEKIAVEEIYAVQKAVVEIRAVHQAKIAVEEIRVVPLLPNVVEIHVVHRQKHV